MRAVAQKLVFVGLLARSRTSAWVIGARNMQKALLQQQIRLKIVEEKLDFTASSVWNEELKDLPFAAIWAAPWVIRCFASSSRPRWRGKPVNLVSLVHDQGHRLVTRQ